MLKGLGYPDKARPFNIELFGGSPDDNNAFFFYDGAMSVLQPLIDKGDAGRQVRPDGHGQGRHAALGCVLSRRPAWTTSCRPTTRTAAASMPCWRPMTACRAVSSRRCAASVTARPNSRGLISGQDAEVRSVKAIIAGEQYSTVFKDTRELAKVTANLVDAALSGGKPEINDEKTYNNGVKVVPSYLLVPVSVVKDDIQKVLVDSGYIKAEEIK
jgi:putative multiple sugar transport system substrate-binding protein